MKNYYIMTLFPDMIMSGLKTSITGRAKKNGIINFEAVNIRDFTNDKHGHVDDFPWRWFVHDEPQPVYDCYKYIENKIGKRTRVVYLTPQGKVFNQQMAKELAHEDDIVFLCGHYEGIDERVLEMIVTDYVSIGDYVLTGGELPAMVMIDSISRMVKGVLSNEVSAQDESFSDNLLEYPQYTRPEEFMGSMVPEVLLSGHHANIEKWRHNLAVARTVERRPDLFSDNGKTDKLIECVIEYFEGDVKRIQHMIKVYSLASHIAKMEKVDERTRYILETAAIVHDIGIKISEEKHGNCSGKLQERYGPREAQKLLLKLCYDEELIERVKYLVGHHHTYEDITGIDYQILVEADFLVNMHEEDMTEEQIKKVYSTIFRTDSGMKMCEQIYSV